MSKSTKGSKEAGYCRIPTHHHTHSDVKQVYLPRSLLLLGPEHPFGDVLMPDDHAVGMVLRRQSGETAVRDPLALDVEDVGFVELDTTLPVRTPNKKVSLTPDE